MGSIRARLLVGILSGTAVSLSTAGWLIHRAHQRQLFELFDASMETAAVALAGRLEFDRGGIEFDGGDPSLADAEGSGLGALDVQVLDTSGESLFRSRSLGRDDLPRPAGESWSDATVTPYRDSDGVRHRAIALRIAVPVDEDSDHDGEHRTERGTESDRWPPGTKQAIIVVAAGTEDLWRRSSQHGMLILRCCAAAVGGSVLIAWLVVQFGLRPLRPLERQIAATTPETLGTRLDPPKGASELTPIVDRLNELLSRLDEAFQRERTLSANVAHELRTPIAALISTVEVNLRKPRRDEEYVAALRDCLAVAGGMHKVVASLLTLSKLESGELRADPVMLPIRALVESEWNGLEPAPADRGVVRIDDGDAAAQFCVDRELLRIALGNALSNAARHAPDGSAVRVGVRQDGGRGTIIIENAGCDVSPADADRVFDRFWRSDRARANTNLHCGLGATLIRRAMQAMDGTATAEIDGRLFVLRLELPDQESTRPPR